MHIGLHHAETRKKDGSAKFLDHLMIVVGLAGPLALIPQLITIWIDKDISGLSLLTWSLLAIGSLLWLIYGIARRMPAIIAGNTLLTIFNCLIVIGILSFR